VQYHRG